MKWHAALAVVLCIGPAAASDYVPLPGGRFESVLPQGPVPTVSTPVDVQAFALRETPVTVGEFLAFVEKRPEWQQGRVPRLFADARYLSDWVSPLRPSTAGSARAPVVNVSWFA